MVGTHNSPFVGDGPFANQIKPVEAQLSSGARFLTAQTRKSISGEIQLCHTSCVLLNAGKLTDYLMTVKAWLDSHPLEIVTVLLTNPDGFPISKFGEAMVASGLSTYAYAPNKTLSQNEWPTFQELIDVGHRLVMYLDYGANASAVPYILDEFTYFFETSYSETDPEFKNCDLDRPKGANTTSRMLIMNHILHRKIGVIEVPDKAAAAVTNSIDSVVNQTLYCMLKWGKFPTFFLVDFFDHDYDDNFMALSPRIIIEKGMEVIPRTLESSIQS